MLSIRDGFYDLWLIASRRLPRLQVALEDHLTKLPNSAMPGCWLCALFLYRSTDLYLSHALLDRTTECRMPSVFEMCSMRRGMYHDESLPIWLLS